MAAVSCFPTPGTESTTDDVTTDAVPSIITLRRDTNLVSYIQNFKNVMAAYVSSQYNNLTVNEMDKVKDTLEEFLRGFANDLKDAVQGNFF
jgi:hypothetical protein